VSLPLCSPVPESEGILPASAISNLVSRFHKGKNGTLANTAVGFGKTGITIEELGGDATITLPNRERDFPPVEKVIGPMRNTLLQIVVSVKQLKKLVDAANEFAAMSAEELFKEDANVLLTFEANSEGTARVCAEMDDNHQTFLGITMCSDVSRYHAQKEAVLPDAYTVLSAKRDAEAEARREAASKQVEETAE
jgi:hypothetical protein